MSKSIVTARTVRDTIRGNEKVMATLSPEARKTVEPGARGRLHPEVVKAYNKPRRGDRRYVLGAGKVAKAKVQTDRQRAAEIAAVQGISMPKRGPLPKALKALL